ncbi:hypothetical protein BDV29DRAFT_70052 [Aspergillus leporis]|uniref:Uncharacterized protein n=1 Tax=Aspergillus leporis TaxID=41062 RepID=A0A5N5WL35_9EURO|nr:hypothetical protein BDV29DRAFT_70052 [Aspergillus leporis]
MIRQAKVKCEGLQAFTTCQHGAQYRPVTGSSSGVEWGQEKRLHQGAYLGFCFVEYKVQLSAIKKITPKRIPVCRNNFEQFLEAMSLLCESFLRSPQNVTWLGSDAAGQGALGSMSHLMRCQTKCDILASDARSSIASTRQSREGRGGTTGRGKINKRKKSYAVFERQLTDYLPLMWL